MSSPVRIPVDIDVADRIVGPLTARQIAILAGGAVPIWLLWTVHDTVGLLGFAIAAVPLSVLTVVLAFARFDGVALDRLVLCAAGQRLAHPTDRAATARARHDTGDDSDGGPPGRAEWAGRVVQARGPIAAVRASCAGGELGILEVYAPGSERLEALSVIGEVTPVNLALRNPGEQEALVAGFARWLHSLTAGAQILTRTQRVDLCAHLTHLHTAARDLPHALGAAALGHATHLRRRAREVDLLERRTFVVLTEPTPASARSNLAGPTGSAGSESAEASAASSARRRALEDRLRRRLDEAQAVLGAAGIVLTPLDAAEASDVTHTATHADRQQEATGHPSAHRDLDSHEPPTDPHTGPPADLGSDPATGPILMPVVGPGATGGRWSR